ncbi:MAG TPA: hypothetical protein PK929_15290 [Quisquiliibacterium sp.]|nr:hypothetical protein [Quisquiliibacterium sp.]
MQDLDTLSTVAAPRRRRFVFSGGALVAVSALPGPLRAQAWPSKPIRIVSAQAPGSSVDAMARRRSLDSCSRW